MIAYIAIRDVFVSQINLPAKCYDVNVLVKLVNRAFIVESLCVPDMGAVRRGDAVPTKSHNVTLCLLIHVHSCRYPSIARAPCDFREKWRE